MLLLLWPDAVVTTLRHHLKKIGHVMPLTWNAIYLGQDQIIDLDEKNHIAENAFVLAGKTYGSSSNPLSKNVYSVTSVNNSGVSYWLDQSNPITDHNDQIRVDLDRDGKSEAYDFDAATVYRSTITFSDLTTENTLLIVFQTTEGHTFVAPGLLGADDLPGTDENTLLVSKEVESISLNCVFSNDHRGLTIDRPVLDFVCFSAGTMIQVKEGSLPVELLKVDDLVLTVDDGLQPIRWIGQATIDLTKSPYLCPVRIKAGALGPNMPAADLIVSPQHRIFVRSKIARRMFDAEEVLVAAKQLLSLSGVELATEMTSVTYVHFLFDSHQLVWSNGAVTESLHIGSESMKCVGAAALQEIIEVFPELAEPGIVRHSARLLVKGRDARKLANRHRQNKRNLVEI